MTIEKVGKVGKAFPRLQITFQNRAQLSYLHLNSFELTQDARMRIIVLHKHVKMFISILSP